MKTPAVVAVEQPAEAFTELFAAASRRGVRVGWLDVAAIAEPPDKLASAASAGAAKVVAAGAGGTVTWKRRVGAAVLRDLLREQFLGFGVVLLAGGQGTPRLARDGDGYRFESEAGARRMDLERLLDELLRPRHRA